MLILISVLSMLMNTIQNNRIERLGIIWCLILALNSLINNDSSLVLYNNWIKWEETASILEIALYIIGLIYIGPQSSIEKVISLWCAVLLIYTNDWMCFFIVLEFQSLIFYLLVSKSSISSALKYFIIGSLASTFILLGIALDFVNLVILGILIKLGTPPFHQWNIDIMDSSEIDITAWFSTIGKLSLIYILVNLITPSPFIILAIISSLVLGTFMGLIQFKIKRLVAYSGVIHLAFMLLGKGDSNLIYMLVYSASLIVFLLIVEHLDALYISDLRVSPFLYPILLISLLSLAGFPPFIGFIGKLVVIESIVEERFWLGMIAMIASIFSFFIYFNVMRGVTIKEQHPNVRGVNPSISWGNSWLISYGTLAPLLLFWPFI